MSYPLNAPITFVNTNGGTDELDFQADVGTNKIKNFVVTTAGDLTYRTSGGNNYLDRLGIGSTGQVLTVSSAGLPSWQSDVASADVFTAYVTPVASPTGIPTSRDTGVSPANPGQWFLLGGNTAPGPFVTWSTASPGSNPDGSFVTASGANYGQFVVPVGAGGIYRFDALVTFDSGTGVNAGVGITSPSSGFPLGMAIRQAQIVVVNTGVPLATISQQVSGSNSNVTALSLTVVSVNLNAGDRIGIQVRHDRSGSNTCTIGNNTIVLPSDTYFSGQRIR